MIIFNAMGGLGNQFFQYATARNLSIVHKSELRCDFRRYRKYTKNLSHFQALKYFGVVCKQASYIEVFLIKYIFRNTYKEMMNNSLKKEIFELPDNTYVQGYFLSFKYFNDIRSILVKELQPNIELSDYCMNMLKLINGENSVFLHVRRGDYLDPGNIENTVEISSLNYYRNSINYILTQVREPQFFVFSDDIDWAEENINIKNAIYIKNNSEHRTVEDFWLMRCCRHGVLSGASTFSWWAAYLDNRPGKIVVHPDTLPDSIRVNKFEDYFPDSWMPVKCN